MLFLKDALYIPNQKFDSIKILIFCHHTTKFEKNQPC